MTSEQPPPIHGKLSEGEANVLLNYLTSGVTAQAPLHEVFQALGEEITDKRLSAVANRLAMQLSRGIQLGQALESVSGILPNHYQSALQVGINSGNLAGVLEGLSQSELARKQMWRNLFSALAYPLLVLSFLFVVTTSISIIVIPEFTKLYEDFDLDLPELTQGLLFVSGYLPKALWGFAIFLLILVGNHFVFGGSRLLYWARNAFPILGRAWTWSGQHEFASLMGTLTDRGVPIDQALRCTAASLRDRNVAWASQVVNTKCNNGMQLSQAMSESLHFDQTMTSLVAWGESHGDLSEALREAAQTYEKQMMLYSQFLCRIMPPVMMTIVIVTLLLLVSGMFLPLVDLINYLSG